MKDDVLYDVMGFNELMIHPGHAEIITRGERVNTPVEVSQKLVDAIGLGYEVYQAIPYSTSEVSGIKYILRRKRKKQISFQDKKFKLAFVQSGLISSLEQAIVLLLSENGMYGG